MCCVALRRIAAAAVPVSHTTSTALRHATNSLHRQEFWSAFAALHFRPSATPSAPTSLSKQMGIIEGVLFGVMGAALAAVYLILAGVTRTVVGRAKSWLDARIGMWPRVVVLTTTGGAVVGALGWAMPLTLTDGAAQLNAVLFKSAQVG